MNAHFSMEGPRRVVFGNDESLSLGAETALLGAKKVLVVLDPKLAEIGLADPALGSLKDAQVEYTVFSDITREPEPAEADAAAELGKDFGAQAVIGIGGGSALDLAKAAAALITNEGQATDYVGIDLVRKPALPIICLPSTAGTGSECTFTAVFTRRSDKFKGGINSRYLYAHTAILDPKLTVTCPPYITAIVGMDALTHAMESYTSLIANPMSELVGLEAVRLIGRWLRPAVANGENLVAREKMLLASYLAGLALARAGVGAVHAMAYPLGAFFDIPHGEANALLLPYVSAFNQLACPDRFAALGRALADVPADIPDREAADRTVDEIFLLAEEVGIPSTLDELNVPREQVPAMAAKAMTVAKPIANNPRKVTAADLEHIYHSAFQPDEDFWE
jgi:alcohol dehydrogenase